jgi:hypothetical protein
MLLYGAFALDDLASFERAPECGPDQLYEEWPVLYVQDQPGGCAGGEGLFEMIFFMAK